MTSSEPDHGDAADLGDDVVVGVGDRGFAHHEGHGAGAAGFLVDVRELAPAQQRVAGPDGLHVLELLLAVQDARDVGAEVLQHRAGVVLLVAERDGESRRGDDVPPRRRASHLVIEVERREVADGPSEVLDLGPLHVDDVRRILLALDARIDLDGHAQALPFFAARSRNRPRSGTMNRSWRPSAIFSTSSHASTENSTRLPSTSRIVAFARTLMPSGVAARCFTSTMVPTLPPPGAK